MSVPFSNTSNGSGSNGAAPGVVSLLDPGQAAGNQAQTGLLLQLIQRIVAAMEGGLAGAGFFTVYPVTTAGNLDIGAQYPLAKSGSFIIRQTVPGPITVTLPPSGGPWFVADGSGVAGANPITVVGSGGDTIQGAASYVLAFNWQSATFILDGGNFVVGF